MVSSKLKLTQLFKHSPKLWYIGLELFSHQYWRKDSDVLWITWSQDSKLHCRFISNNSQSLRIFISWFEPVTKHEETLWSSSNFHSWSINLLQAEASEICLSCVELLWLSKDMKEVKGEGMVIHLLGKLTKLEETGKVWWSPPLPETMQSHNEGAICPKVCFLRMHRLFWLRILPHFATYRHLV